MCTVSTLKQADSASPQKSYHHGDLRQTLVQSGIALLEAKGVTGFSLRALARQVGVSPNAAYRHFANKEALLMALAAEGFRQFSASQQATWARTEGTNSDRFLAAGCAYVEFAATHPALFRLMFGWSTPASRSGELESASAQAFGGLRLAVAAVLNKAPDEPQVELAAYNAWALVHGYSHLILDGQLPNDANAIQQKVEQALRFWLGNENGR